MSSAHAHTPVCTLTVHRDDGVEVKRRAVCPRSGALTPLEQCIGCPHLVRVGAAAGGPPTALECRSEEAATEALGPDAPVLAWATTGVVAFDEDTPVGDARARLGEVGASSAPVVDDRGVLAGIVSVTDLDRGSDRLPPDWPSLTVGEVMTVEVDTVKADATVGEAAALLADRRRHHAPVVASDGRVVAMISTLDLVVWLARTRRGA